MQQSSPVEPGDFPAQSSGTGGRVLVVAAVAAIVAVLLGRWLVNPAAPDPVAATATTTSALLDIAVLVFREGLECILVLSAITASMSGPEAVHRRPVYAGAAVGGVVTLITWFAAVGIVSDLLESVPALDIQAATGLLAIIVLLVVMNWFFHEVYWGGWISLHNRRKRALLNADGVSRNRVVLGLGLLGFTSLYREGFEVVLFLQSYHLKLGNRVVLEGATLGLALTFIVAALNVIAHRRLHYRKMLVLTGVMLGVVLLVMVGEEAQEMQLAHWLPTTEIPILANVIPDWMGLWFAVFPTVETLSAQVVAAALVIGSYAVAGRKRTSPGPQL